ncbi:MAG: hypothetical protein KatS3mg101_0122 [Patescibacteria group bacterium]|nr:MAG: hypothetical protein KatS3mg101_0122 [Patescibacteria group bacterium]
MNFVASTKHLLSKPFLLIYSFVVFAIPLIFSQNTGEFYEFPKITFFYTLGAFIFALYISDTIIWPRKNIRLPLVVVLFAVSFAVSTLVSSHPYTSVFGYYSRFADSLLFYLAVLCFYYIAMNVLSKKDIGLLFNVAHFGSVILFLFALGQYFSLFTFLWGGQLQERVFSTLGQPNWYAQYLTMLLGISMFEFLFKGRKVYLLFCFVQFFSLWLTFSMSGLAGFILTIFSYFYLFLFGKEKIEGRKNFLFRVAAVLALVFVVSLLFPGIFRAKLRDMITDFRKVVGGNFLVYAQNVTETNQISDPGYIRSGLWRGTVDMIISNPKIFILGSGPETFPYYFQKFRPLSLNYSSEWNFVFNKPHNYYLEIWAEQGILGIISYLLFLIFVLKKVDAKYRGAVIAFAVTNFFGWPTVTTFVIFWLIVSTIGAKNETF